jgi:Polyketide cyclase / dehydrase and lipid transport
MAEARRSDSHADALPTDALKEAGQQLLSLLAQRAAQAATDRVTDLTGRLTGIAENGGTGVISAFRGERSDDDEDRRSDDDSEDNGGERRSGVGGFFGNLKDKVTGLFGGGGGGGGGGKGKKLKVTVISESLDIGLPLRVTYNLWTQYEDFPSFMKKVENVDPDDEKSNWKAQVFWSHREWQATTVEQVPESHIVWKSTGAKGHVDGAVTFTSLGPNLTRVLLVMEYYPQGLFERTGNIWRAQGRRARLEFQHFRRHAMTQAILNQDDIEGWRGEIRDGEVVTTHEEAMEQEQSRAAEGEDEGREDAAAASEHGEEDVEDEGAEEAAADEPREDEETDEEPVDEADEYTEDAEGSEDVEPAEEYDEADDYDEPEDEADEDDEDVEPVDEYDEAEDYDEPEDETDETDEYDEPDDDTEDETRRREPVGARSGRRR